MKTEYQISGMRENGGVHEMVTELASPVTLKSPTADSGPECNIKGDFTNTLWIINTHISVTSREVYPSVKEATVYTNIALFGKQEGSIVAAILPPWCPEDAHSRRKL